ncbi:MAG: hypothetical protein KAR40_16110 [Candidatus Sabulitectum sp.]|nr:hypothetical protein [Candidatus Sabulitectum sp.]
MIKIAVQKDSGSYWKSWEKRIIDSGHECVLLDLRKSSEFDKALRFDGVMWHIDMKPSMQSAASSVLSSLEIGARKPVFPNLETRWHFDNKVSQAYLFKQMGIVTPETNIFWNEEDAMHWVHNQCEFPVVAKLKRGAGSTAVYILRNQQDAERYTRRMFSLKGISGEAGGAKRSPYRIWRDFARNSVLHLPRPILQEFLKQRPRLREIWPNERGYAYFQEFMPANDFDTRITVIGNRAFAFRRFNRDGDFRASGSGKIDYSVKGINMEMVRIAHNISLQNNFQSMAYDFLIDKEGKPTIVEISYAYQSKAVFDCPGHWDRELNWIDGHVLPEAAHVEDFIEEIEKSQKGKH